MSHTFEFTITCDVSVTVERIEGKFATRDEMSEAILIALEEAVTEACESGAYDADLDGLGPDGESSYEVTDVTPETKIHDSSKR